MSDSKTRYIKETMKNYVSENVNEARPKILEDIFRQYPDSTIVVARENGVFFVEVDGIKYTLGSELLNEGAK